MSAAELTIVTVFALCGLASLALCGYLYFKWCLMAAQEIVRKIKESKD